MRLAYLKMQESKGLFGGRPAGKTTGRTNYNQAKEFKREFLELLKGQYNPTNDRLKFTDAADSYMQHRLVAASAGTVRLEKERLRALKRLLAQITIPDYQCLANAY